MYIFLELLSGITDISKLVRILYSSEHLISVLKISEFMSHSSMNDPIYAEKFYEYLGGVSKGLLTEFSLVIIFVISRKHCAETVNPANLSLSFSDELGKKLTGDA